MNRNLHIAKVVTGLSCALGLSGCTAGSTMTPLFEHVRQAASNSRSAAPARAACPTSACIYVSSRGDSPNPPSITVFPTTARGNVAPSSIIVGEKTALGYPTGVAVDASRNVYVANGTSVGDVLVFAAGSNGDVAPTRIIAGPRSQIFDPAGIAVDSQGEIYVINGGPDDWAINVFAADANGNAAPVRTIGGVHTLMHDPLGIVVDGQGYVYVANACCGIGGSFRYRINVYAPGANGDVPPARIIGGPKTALRTPSGVALAANGNIYVSNSFDIPQHVEHRVTEFAAGAKGNVAPSRIIKGPRTKLNNPVGIALDGDENAYVLNHDSSSVTMYGPDERGDAPPDGVIAGNNTQFSYLTGIAIR